MRNSWFAAADYLLSSIPRDNPYLPKIPLRPRGLSGNSNSYPPPSLNFSVSLSADMSQVSYLERKLWLSPLIGFIDDVSLVAGLSVCCPASAPQHRSTAERKKRCCGSGCEMHHDRRPCLCWMDGHHATRDDHCQQNRRVCYQ